ncbi:hypothetical protein QWY82_16370 [Simiduia curdlanivorans]|uniref:Uncharacterized protein n=1 Tax=Simiduia curdlanivorans TaxID=1492769 RepID=A0ABV8UYJ3_9GAMM|nr:hypothetical protein [Simiduia curdlanivorans]MDN3640371.1 hypothetical protein [Simiduia curdlanivorans]
MQESQLKEYVVRNFYKDKGQYQGEWAKLTPEGIYELLKQHSGHSKHAARELLFKMTEKNWTIAATMHNGGFDKNAPFHITVRLKGQSAHHLNCKVNDCGKVYLYEITNKPINYN